MIKLTIPNNNIHEREYIIDIIFREFLNIEYKIVISSNPSCCNWEIELDNGNKIFCEDHFFNKYKTELEYLKLENLPSEVKFTKNKFISKNDVAVIYGSSNFDIKINDREKVVICGIDIFASIFFMLTRWEEYVNKKRDQHNRFSAFESIAFKNGFLERAVVDEYIAMLKNILIELEYDSNRFKVKDYELYISHDVDVIYRWKSLKQVLKIAISDIIKRRSFSLALERILEYSAICRNKINDPYDTFDFLMEKSEFLGTKSRFYFMSGGNTKYDKQYNIFDLEAVDLIEKIKKRKHIIGIHPSYDAYNDFQQLKLEKESLEKISNQKILEGREHYLRFEVPTTWQIWEDVGLEVDSTCGYADYIGFRCGTGKEYSVFNILNRKKLKLKERPLVVMDASLFNYNEFTYESAYNKVLNLMYSTDEFTMLWHNSSVNNIKFYKNLIDMVRQRLISK
ncbi:polysaccharide deacetylase family protein [Sulfurimonas sp.]|uniref:polysaccharide deacetylase family protein n=1 Tax=Sulfurimonas sp. TaxID=2022749 RepID=UPI003562D743